jgi:hypothetical protein
MQRPRTHHRSTSRPTPPSPPKIPPSSPIDKPRNQPQCQPPKPQSPATIFPISSTQHSPYLKTIHRQPQTKRTKPKKPPPPLKPNLFHTDWSRRRKWARFKSRNFIERRKPLVVFEFGVNGSGHGKKDTGLGKIGQKKTRQVRRDNVQGFKVPAIRHSARNRLEEKTGSWLRVAGIGRQQGTGLGRMGSDPKDPMKRGSPPDGISSHRRPPYRPLDGDYAKGGDFGVNHNSPEFSIEQRDEPPCDSMTEAEIPDRQSRIFDERGGQRRPFGTCCWKEIERNFLWGGRTSIYGGVRAKIFFLGMTESPKREREREREITPR